MLAPGVKKLAVACSGGADSLSLALLCHEWGRSRDVAVTALIVDHQLRPESGAEARQTRNWLKAAGLAVVILPWLGDKPAGNRQALARQARYTLLENWCRKYGVAHLLLAQHRDDQAETFLLRAARGSGVDGLAGMAPSAVSAAGIIRLRPLLDVPKSRLLATLQARGQPWAEDPSNHNPAYARSGARAAVPLLGSEAAAHLALTAQNMARARAALEQITAERLAASVAFEPAAGLAWIEPASLLAGPDEIALRALDRLLRRIGGLALPPRLERLERLLAGLRGGEMSHTLHRCRLLPWQGKLLAVREARHLPAPIRLRPGMAELAWDGRFRITPGPGLPPGLSLVALNDLAPPAAPDLPPPAWPGLPVLLRRNQAIAMPSLQPGLINGLICHPNT